MSSSSIFLESGGNLDYTYSRKQKSLGRLCLNFVSLYEKDDVESVGLDDTAKRLGVERRRIYDIVNILESVGVLTRKAKNRYSWIGFSGIPKALENLKEEALRENSGSVEARSSKVEDLEDDEDDRSLYQNEDYGEEKANLVSGGKAKSVTENRREKSLGMLTENFVKMFLTLNVDMVSLDEAARLLLGDAQESSQTKGNSAAKVRRLYDIANVLSSLNLIEKTHHAETRKPAFRWLGLSGKRSDVTIAIPPSPKQNLKRAFGIDVTNTDITKRSRLVSLADKRPVKVQTKFDMKECNPTAQRQLQSSKSYCFGPFSPVILPKREEQIEEKEGMGDHNWENLASSFRPEYHNQALSELFTHYLEAWKSWYAEIAQVTDNNIALINSSSLIHR